MIIILALGNPGQKFEGTRHNAGFELAKKIQKSFNLKDLSPEKKFQALVSKGKIGGKEIVLATPETFMNRSGETAIALLNFYKIPPEKLLVVHDDLDISLGKWKMVFGSGPGGHNGVSDIFKRIGGKNFWRLKIGIEGREKKKLRKTPGEKFVLEKFSQEERNVMEKVLEEIILFFEDKLKILDLEK